MWKMTEKDYKKERFLIKVVLANGKFFNDLSCVREKLNVCFV